MSELDETSDEDLLRRSRQGDESAFTLLYRRRQAGLYRFALRMSGSPAAAEDAVQEVFMALIHAPGRFHPERGSLVGFLYGIARNKVRRHLEKAARVVPLQEPSSGAPGLGATPGDTETGFARRELAATVRQAVLSLPEAYRETVVLVELEGLGYEEAAEALDCAVGTVRSRLYRARRMLAQALAGSEGNPCQLPARTEGRLA
jgi:RNA polymerase sigma-70 factor, ECF subfamily